MCVNRSFYFILIMSLLPFMLQAQDNALNSLSITVEGTGPGGYTFFADNNSPDDFHVIITMTRLIQLRCECTLPFASNVGPGRTKLFSLKRDGLSDSHDYNYEWSFMVGHVNPKVKKDAVYLMPIANGVITETIELKNIQEAYGDELPAEEELPAENFYGIGFKMHRGDTIYAARDGKVRSIKDGRESRKENSVFSRDENEISILHKDKTIATYSIIRNGSFLVKERESIVAGQPLAIVGGDNYTVGPHVRFMLSYLYFDERHASDHTYKWHYLKPAFATERHKPKVLEDKVAYKAVRPEDVLIQDLSKRAIKRRKKKQNGG